MRIMWMRTIISFAHILPLPFRSDNLCNIAVYVSLQHFGLHKLHCAVPQNSSGIHHRLAGFYFGRRDKAADDGDLRNSQRNLFYHLLVALHESRLLQQVTRWIAADSEFRKENHLRALRKGLARRLYDLFGITGEITNGWVDLPQSNLHTSSLNRELVLRQPFSHCGGVFV